MTDSLNLANHFLIAMPRLEDSLFQRSVIYLCEHTANNAMGLVINKPSGIAIAQLLEQINLPLDNAQHMDKTVFFGGPVQPERGFVLHRPKGNWQSSLAITDEIALSTSRDILEALAAGDGPNDIIVTLGYASWTAGQLEEELAQNAWLSVLADSDVIFNKTSAERYNAAIALLGFDPVNLSGELGRA